MRLCLLVFLSLAAGLVYGHESRPFYIDIIEQSPQHFKVSSKVPASVPSYNKPTIVLAEGCQFTIRQKLFNCQTELAGTELEISFPLMNPSISTLIRLKFLNGQLHTGRLGPKQSRWLIPKKESFASVAQEYTELGVEHILIGYDHLLFLACLIFIAGGLRKIIITVTGFTVAHSLTLVLAALGWVSLPIPAIEAVIALSIVFLARELVINRRETLTWRKPVLVSVSFGLLHGFGFASVLSDIGLPQTELAAALLFFNIGVELGQLIFVVVAALVFLMITRVGERLSLQAARLQQTCGFAVGALACFWLFERLAAF